MKLHAYLVDRRPELLLPASSRDVVLHPIRAGTALDSAIWHATSVDAVRISRAGQSTVGDHLENMRGRQSDRSTLGPFTIDATRGIAGTVMATASYCDSMEDIIEAKRG